jgi:CRISPR-associated protein Cmr2
MSKTPYTAVTFAPVQGFIEKSRKLRDLYGSSFLLSYLARAICDAAKQQNLEVISPAMPNVVRGTPNQIVIKGHFPEQEAKRALQKAWYSILWQCRTWIEQQITTNFTWKRDWELWSHYAWEFFWATGNSISEARVALNECKRSRDWVGINWMGESSTLSGADAIAWPGMGNHIHPKTRNLASEDRQIREFYEHLRSLPQLGEAFVEATEQLSIPELVKRLVTYPAIKSVDAELSETFRDLNRLGNENWTGWFQGDGDRIGEYLKSMAEKQGEENALNEFSTAMLAWGEKHLTPSVENSQGRVIYAGGDDFLGVFYKNDPKSKLTALECLDWFYEFPQVWQQHGRALTVSVGFVWAGPQVPQRDVLQHCREAEQAAKKGGRDRLAIRILFNSGNFIEWACPWWFLKEVITGYRVPLSGSRRDRNQVRGRNANWTHFYNDVAALADRHAFTDRSSDVALALFAAYFGDETRATLTQNAWREKKPTGILGSQDNPTDTHKAVNQWIINLAKVGFHLHSGQQTARSQINLHEFVST